MKLKLKEKVQPEAVLSEAEREAVKRRRIVSVASLAAALVVMGLAAWFVGKPLIQFISEPEQFRLWVEAHGIGGQAALVGIRILQTVITILPAEIVEIGSGYAFGAVNGWLLCTLGTVIGTLIICLLTRKFGMKMVEAFIPREKIESVGILKDCPRLYLMVFLLFLIPGTPKDTLTYLIGLTPMKLPTFLLLMSIARIPSILSSTLGGAALGTKDYDMAILVFALTAALSIIGIVAYAVYSKRKKAQGLAAKA